ncbi:MAG: ATP-binding protein [Lachnospiraceae bacterium]
MIKKIYFNNFKCYKNAELSTENLTTLIGTNSSGKTNAIEGMMILSEVVSGRELSTILDGTKNGAGLVRGGSKGCARFKSDYFGLGCLISFDEKVDLKYEIEISVEKRVAIRKESLTEIKGKTEKQMFYTKEVTVDSGDIAVSCNNGKTGKNPDITCIRSSSVISQIASKLSTETKYGKNIVEYANKVIETMKNMLFLNPEISQMRSYSVINDIELKVNASNISSVLYQLCKDRDNKKLLLDIMSKLPENEIRDISFEEGPLNDVILFLNEVYGKKEERIDSSRLSDGTLRCLAIITALLNEKEGGMIAIEEVDNGIHPGRAKMLIQQISDIASKRNIDVLITTHNAILLNTLSKKDLYGVNIAYRNSEDGSGKIVQFTKIDDMPALLANGKLGDVFTDGKILNFIKEDKIQTDYSWLGV